jgi:hypothetical protein
MAFNKKVYKGMVSHIYRCSRYAMHGKSVCSTHSISMDTLVSTVLADIKQNARLAASERQALMDRLLQHCGNVPDNIFKRMLTAYDTEQTTLNSSIAQLQSEIDAKRNES